MSKKNSSSASSKKSGVASKGLPLEAKKLAVTAKQLTTTSKTIPPKAQKIALTAKKLAAQAKIPRKTKKLPASSKMKGTGRRKLAVTAERLRIRAKKLEVTAKKIPLKAQKLAVTAKQLAVSAKKKETVRRKLAVTAENLSLKAKKLALTAKKKETVRRKLAITAKHLAVTVQKLAVTAQEKATMLASIGDGLFTTDEKGNITLINKTAQKLLNIKSKEVIGKIFSEILLEDEKGVLIPLPKRPMSMALSGTPTSTGATEGATYYYVRKDKTKFPVAITATPVIIKGKVIGTVEVFRDITVEKEIDKAKTEFITIASHQLKTPPTAIKLLTERLLSGKLGSSTEKQQEYLKDIQSSNQRMIDLVNALLNVSRIELGAFTIKVNEKDVVDIIKSILNELQPVIDKKHLTLKTEYPEKNVLLKLDEALFQMVINNLVTNAIHYTAEGGEIKVQCHIVEKGQLLGEKHLPEGSFAVSISDTGYGIPKKDQGKLFTKFFRADNARAKLSEGTGLGLYIVKSVLDHSGGNIWFTSKENVGSIFYVTIPLTGMRKKAGEKELID